MRGFDFTSQRRVMVDEQLRRRGISDERVLVAMNQVPRQEFVPPGMQASAYDDGALPIGQGQTISQPYVVAFMAEVAQIKPDEKVLEVGTGSGYAAAVLGLLAREVHSVERIAELAAEAKERLQRLGYANVFTHLSDGTEGLAAHAPYSAIMVPAAAQAPPQPLLDQLDDGGRLVIPIGERGGGQRMKRFTRRGSALEAEDLGPFAFVPLIGEHGFPS
jgi:protein-L-isoaspartate(D-aspartate) O-methyltransferase